MSKTKIEWADATWNPVTGCTAISKGCKNCYAHRFALRLQKMRNQWYERGFKPTVHWARLNNPQPFRPGQKVFVCSMGDLFHDSISAMAIQKTLDVIRDNPETTFQILTKRPERLSVFGNTWPKNAWVGVTVEDSNNLYRLDYLRDLPPWVIRFVSFEPLLGPVAEDNSFSLKGVDWVIAGGETGPGKRNIEEEWVDQLIEKVKETKLPFFFKQWNMKGSRVALGQEWNEFPEGEYLPKRLRK